MTESSDPRIAQDNRPTGWHRRRNGIWSIDVVVGGQFGSEAKGHVTAQIVRNRNHSPQEVPVLNIRVGGPNAGHTVVAPDESGEYKAFAFRTLPVGIVERGVYCAIAPGSELDAEVLLDEIKRVKDARLWDENQFLLIDPEVTIIDDEHKQAEARHGLTVDSGNSTGKGIGAARADRLMRGAARLADRPQLMERLQYEGVVIRPLSMLYTTPTTNRGDVRYQVVIEGIQGYGLGLHAGYYPKCTSSDTTAGDFLAMAGLSPWHVPPSRMTTWVVFRPFPIRIAGDSGPLYGETSWEELGLPEERTTVTQRVRRVGRWDAALAEAAVRANGGGYDAETWAPKTQVKLALSMADQLDPGVYGTRDIEILETSDVVMKFIDAMESHTGGEVALATTGPNTAVWL